MSKDKKMNYIKKFVQDRIDAIAKNIKEDFPEFDTHFLYSVAITDAKNEEYLDGFTGLNNLNNQLYEMILSDAVSLLDELETGEFHEDRYSRMSLSEYLDLTLHINPEKED